LPRAPYRRGMRAPRTGAITFVQRFGGLVNLNVHFHLVVPDGVFVDADDRLAFALHPVPSSGDVLAILDRIVRRVARRFAHAAIATSRSSGCIDASAAGTARPGQRAGGGGRRLRVLHCSLLGGVSGRQASMCGSTQRLRFVEGDRHASWSV
jgi:hypothetical protein